MSLAHTGFELVAMRTRKRDITLAAALLDGQEEVVREVEERAVGGVPVCGRA